MRIKAKVGEMAGKRKKPYEPPIVREIGSVFEQAMGVSQCAAGNSFSGGGCTGGRQPGGGCPGGPVNQACALGPSDSGACARGAAAVGDCSNGPRF